MRFINNRFVFLNLPMLSLETHLGVTASPQVPFPTDYVTLPVSASHRRFGSLPLAAEEGHIPAAHFFPAGLVFQSCSNSFTPSWGATLAGRTVGDVSHPCLVSSRQQAAIGLSQKLVWGDGMMMTAISGARFKATFASSAEAIYLHESGNATSRARTSLPAKHNAQSAAAIGLPTHRKRLGDTYGQIDIFALALALLLVAVGVITATADFQNGTEFFDRKFLFFHFLDQREAFQGSWPNMEQAFFKMSRWRLTISSSRRSRAFSLA